MTSAPASFLTAKTLAHVPHGFFGRRGGTSSGAFGTLNQSVGVGDDDQAVRANRRLAAALLHLQSPVTFVRQEHKTRVVSADNIATDEATADGLTSHRPDRPIGILTADCVPVLLATPDGKQVLALHAGWRGLTQSIVGESVSRWCSRFNLKPHRLLAAIGPAIGPCCFEIQGEALASLSALTPRAITRDEKSGTRARADLFAIAQTELMRADISRENIETLAVCTRCASDRYFSYRHAPLTGRQAAIIAPRPFT